MADMLFTASSGDIWINALWFTSFALGISTALLAVVVKQWLRQYTCDIRSGSNLDRACARQSRFDNFKKWKVHLLVDILPTILHLALFLFMIGLVVFLFPLNHILAYFLATITGLLCIAYITASILPMFLFQCPYHTPLTHILHHVYVYTPPTIKWIYKTIYHESSTLSPSKPVEDALQSSQKFFKPLLWLTHNSADPSVKAIIAESWGAVCHYTGAPILKGDFDDLGAGLQKHIYHHFCHIYSHFRSGKKTLDDEASFGQLIRASFGHQEDYIHDLWDLSVVETSDFHTMLAVAACGRPTHFQWKTKDKNLLEPYDVFNFVVENFDESVVRHSGAPCWVWQSLCAQAADHNKFSDVLSTIAELRKHMEKKKVLDIEPTLVSWMEGLHLPIIFQCAVLNASPPNEYLKNQELHHEDIIYSPYSVIPLPTFLKGKFRKEIRQKFDDYCFSLSLYGNPHLLIEIGDSISEVSMIYSMHFTETRTDDWHWLPAFERTR